MNTSKIIFGKIIQKVSVLTIHFTQFRTKLHRKLPSSTWTHFGLMVNTVPRVQRLGEVIAFPKDQDSIYSHTPKIKPRLCITLQNKTKQKNQNKKLNKTKQNKKLNKTKQNKTKQNKTKQNKTKKTKHLVLKLPNVGKNLNAIAGVMTKPTQTLPL